MSSKYRTKIAFNGVINPVFLGVLLDNKHLCHHPGSYWLSTSYDSEFK